MTLSPHQLFMLRMFAKGWRFNIFNKKPGSWCTYWSLRRRGLIRAVSATDVLTDKGKAVIAARKEKWK
jgi:hypothetical protein